MSIQLQAKPRTDIGTATVTRCEPSQRGRKAGMTAKHKGRTLPQPIGEATYAADDVHHKARKHK